MPILFDDSGEMTIAHPPHLRRSESVNEIISNKPSFLVRWGLTLFLLILLSIILTSAFIRYPDVVPAKAKLTSINAPKAIVTKLSGKLASLRVKENDIVQRGKIIGSIESTGKEEEILALSSAVDSMDYLIEMNYSSSLWAFTGHKYLHLGEVQSAYQTFLEALLSYCEYTPGGYFLKKRTFLQSDRLRLQRLDNHLRKQHELTKKDLFLEQQTIVAYNYLLNEKVISALDYRKEESVLLGKEQALPQSSLALLSNDILQADKQKELLELENTIKQQKLVFMEALHSMRAAIDDWKATYLLIAPIEGKIAFATFLQEDQQLNAQQIICYINPASSAYYAETYIRQASFGKIHEGQKVLIKLDAYPDAEYGSLEGRLEFISRISTDSGYLAKVSLSHGLMTNFGKVIQFRDGLTASAEIVTKDMALIRRFYYNIAKNIGPN